MKTISFGGGTYSSYSASDQGEDGVSVNFYQEFIKSDLFRSVKIVSWQIKEQQLGKNVKPFTVYIIQVVTVDIEYRVEKRYSSFRNLYKKISSSSQRSSYFPKLTLFSSGVDQAVVSQRFRILNQFLSEIYQEKKFDDLVFFFDFLEIRSTYERQGISLPTTQIKGSTEDQLTQLMTRLGYESEEGVTILNEVEKKLLESRIKISGELIRIVYQGIGKRPGLMEICNNATNHMVCLRVLEMILRLTSFEHNRDAQMYCKGLANCPPKTLLLQFCLLQFSQIKINYFRVLQIYFKRNNQINMQDALQMLFDRDPETIRQFNMWMNNRQRTSLVAERLEERSPDRRSEVVDKLRNVLQMPDQKWKTVKSYRGKNKVILRTYQTDFIRITALSDQPKQKLKESFIQNSLWKKYVQRRQKDQDILKIWLKLHNEVELLMFEQETTNQGTYYQRVRKPPVYLRQALSYFQIMQCHNNRVEICIMTNTKKARDFFSKNTLFLFSQAIAEIQ